MLLSEIKKILGIKHIRLLCLLLLTVNILICVIVTTPGETYPNTVELSEFFEIYDAAPEETVQKITENIQASQSILFDGELDGSINLYTDTAYGDEGLLREREKQKQYVSDFRGDLELVVRNAGINISDMKHNGISEDSYLIRYQRRAESLYKDHSETIEVSDVNTVAWESYFGNTFESVIAFVMMTATVITTFMYETDAGTDSLIVATARGRRKVLAGKLAFTAVCSLAVAVVLSAASFAVYLVRGGLCSPDLSIHTLRSFELCPFKITIGEYAIIRVFIKALTVLVFSLATAAVTSVLRNHVLSYLVSLGLIALNFALSIVRYTEVKSYLRCFNLNSFYNSKLIFSRYTAQNIFSNPINAVYVGMCIYAVLSLVFAVAVGFLWMNKSRVKKLRKVKQGRERTNQKKVHISPQRSLLFYELRKIVLSPKTLVFVLAVFVAYTYLTADAMRAPNDFNDSVLRYYMRYYAGEVTDEKLAEIDGLASELGKAVKEYNDKKTAYDNGELSYDEYTMYLAENSEVMSRYETLKPLMERTEYLRGVKDSGDTVPHFIYDTGLKKMFSDEYAYLIFALIVALMSKSFPTEYESKSSRGGFVNILRATKYGRRKTFMAKYAACVLVAVTLSAVSVAINIAVYLNEYGEGLFLSAPVVSMPVFFGDVSGLTIGDFIILSIAVRLAASAVLSVTVISVSYFLRQIIPTMSVIFTAAFLPLVLAKVGIEKAALFSFYDLFGAFEYYLQSIPQSCASISLMLAGILTVSVIVTVPAFIRYCERN